MLTLQSHEQRKLLNDEVHARPPVPVRSPSRITSITVNFGDDEQSQKDAILHLTELIGLPAPLPNQVHYVGMAGDLSVHWSLHTEFARYTFIVTGEFSDPFDRTALDRIPPDWIGSLPGKVLVALHAALLPAAREAETADISTLWFGGNELIGAEIGESNGLAYTDLRLHPDAKLPEGFSRYVIIDRNMGANQTGRMLQRLFEIETYRFLTLLALPIAKKQMRDLDLLGTELRQMTERIGAPEESDAALLAELTELATKVEQMIAESQYRFSAANAYYQLVASRIAELRERRIPGMQPFQEFMERRLTPAINTCATVVRRQDRMATRLQRTTALLRTRVEVQHEEQNRALLASMDRRAALQLRLQETVEGLSVGVLTYYAIGLISYASKALKAAGIHLDSELVPGLAIPVVAGVVWLGVKRAKQKLGH